MAGSRLSSSQGPSNCKSRTPLPFCLLHCDTVSPLQILPARRMKTAVRQRSPRRWREGRTVTQRRLRSGIQLPKAASKTSRRTMITAYTQDLVTQQLDRVRQLTMLATKEPKRSPLHHKNRPMGMGIWIAQRRLRNLPSFFPRFDHHWQRSTRPTESIIRLEDSPPSAAESWWSQHGAEWSFLRG